MLFGSGTSAFIIELSGLLERHPEQTSFAVHISLFIHRRSARWLYTMCADLSRRPVELTFGSALDDVD